jgi:hypothetical protein
MDEAKGRLAARVVRVTPGLARQWLAKNVHNRPLSEDLALHYAEAMARGEWELNGEPVIFGPGGVLVDGQHRLHAVVLADVAVEMLVVEGVGPGAFATIDVGKGRTPGDALALAGEKNASVLAAAAALWWRYEAGRMKVGGRRRHPTRRQLVQTVADNPGLRDSLAACMAVKARLTVVWTMSQATFVHYAGSRRHPEAADSFVHQVATGEGLTATSPVALFRDRLIRNRAGKARLPSHEMLALAVKAFNAHATGRPVGNLRWLDTEPFPSVV